MEDVKRRTKGRKKERKEREARGGLHSSSGGFYEKKRGEAGRKTRLSEREGRENKPLR